MNKKQIVKGYDQIITDEQKKLIRNFILINLLIYEIDKLKEQPKKEIEEVYDILKQAITPLETIIDKVYESKELRRTTFIQNLEDKFDYNILRETQRFFKVK